MWIWNRTQAFDWYHFNDLERPITQISRSRHYLISEPVPNIYSYNGILIGTYTRPTQGCHFEWPWVILSDLAKYLMTQNITRSLCDSWACCIILSCVLFLPRRQLARCCLGSAVFVILFVMKFVSNNVCLLAALRDKGFLSRISTDARYWHSKSVCQSVCLSASPSVTFR